MYFIEPLWALVSIHSIQKYFHAVSSVPRLDFNQANVSSMMATYHVERTTSRSNFEDLITSVLDQMLAFARARFARQMSRLSQIPKAKCITIASSSKILPCKIRKSKLHNLRSTRNTYSVRLSYCCTLD